MSNWTEDKRWSDRFIPTIKSILGQVMFSTAPLAEDAERNTDLLVLSAGDIRVACRIRRHQHLARYGEEFTMRAARESGAKTELSKVINGWGNLIFYGFSNESEDGLSQWVIGDLDKFRAWIAGQMAMPRHRGLDPWDIGECAMNRDRGSFFVAYRWDAIPDVVVASGFDTCGIPSIHYLRDGQASAVAQ